MDRPARRWSAIASVAVIIVGCGSPRPPAAARLPVATTTEWPSLPDRTFAVYMERHHRQTIELAELASDAGRRASPAIAEAAAQLLATGTGQAQLLRNWLSSARVLPSDSDTGDLVYIGGMLSPEELHQLGELSGPDFDRTWLVLTIRHLHGAIEIAQSERADGTDQATLSLASSIVAESTNYMSTLETLLIG